MVDRVKVKEEAKTKISGNKWNIIWPVLVIGFIVGLIEGIFGLTPKVTVDMTTNIFKYEMPTAAYIGVPILSLLSGIVMAGYQKYILNFVRTGKFNSNDILDCVKEKWLNILIATVLVAVLVGVCSMLLVVPGIIMALALMMVTYLVVDTDISGADAIKKSMEMMKGHKWNYFVYTLSFIGWLLLVPFTFGILMIWLYPYMTVANALYYEKLKELNK